MADLNRAEPLYPTGITHYDIEIVDDDPAARLDAFALRVERLEHEVAVLTAAAKVEKS
jgi:aspartate 1-decarboxylase